MGGDIRVKHGKAGYHHAAHGMSDDSHFVDAQFIQQRLHIGSDKIEVVGNYRLGRLAVANAIHCQNPKAIFRQHFQGRGIGFGVEVHAMLPEHHLAIGRTLRGHVHIGHAHFFTKAFQFQKLHRIGVVDFFKIGRHRAPVSRCLGWRFGRPVLGHYSARQAQSQNGGERKGSMFQFRHRMLTRLLGLNLLLSVNVIDYCYL
jgi:hypothetical protein